METAAQRYQSRKFILAFATLVIATFMALNDRLSGAEWVDAAMWILGLYYGANVAYKATGKFGPVAGEGKS